MKSTSKHIVTLNAKLSVPLPVDTIARPRLRAVFAQIERQKVLTVVAGAGYGKTTFVAEACRHLGIDTVWYRLDPSDRDLITFLHYLVAGIRRYYPGFGRQTLGRIASAQAVKQEQRTILTTLLNEMDEFITAALVLVLDDYHLVQTSNEIQEALLFWVQNLSANIHLVIVGRTAPELQLSRLMAGRQAFEIGEKELAFDAHEVEALYRDIFGTPLIEETLTLLRRKTDGWVTGLILLNHMLKDKSDADINWRLQRLQLNSSLLANYLEENIYNLLARRTADFLLRTAILSRLEIDVCNQLLQIDDAAQILSELERKHLFTFCLDNGQACFYYHQLLRDFLLAKLTRESDHQLLAALHRRAAEIWEVKGESQEAIDHYLCAGQYEKARALLNQIGRELIRGGRLNLFLSYHARIPEAVVDQEPWLVYLYGRALELAGKTQAAIQTFDKAQTLFHQKGLPKGVGLALNRLASNYYVVGDYGRAESKFKLLLAGIRDRPRLYVDALGHLIFILAHLGQMDEADRYYAQAMQTLAETEESDLHAWIYINDGFRHLVAGNPLKAKAHGEKANTLSLRKQLFHLLTLGYQLVAAAEYQLGHFEAGLEIALKGIQTGEEKGFIETAHAWNWNNASFCATALGHYAKAIEYAGKGLQVCKELNSLWSESWAHRALADAYLKSGDVIHAEASARDALRTIAPLDLPFDKAVMQTGLAAVLLEKNAADEALALLEGVPQALGRFVPYSPYALVLRARCLWIKGQKKQALVNLRQALVDGQKVRHDRWLVAERGWIIPLLTALHPDEELRGYIERLFSRFGYDALVELKQLHEKEKGAVQTAAASILNTIRKLPPPDLRIVCFGKFRIWRGDVELRPDQWPGEKPKLLFKYLCFHYAKGYLPKDTLLEALWPDQAPAVTSKRLHVALTKLRQTLEPELARGMTSAYLLRKAEAYQLNLGPGGQLDIDRFDGQLVAARQASSEERALAHYLRAESYYGGHLFAENTFIPWCQDAAASYKEKYLDTLTHIIAGYRRNENWPKCIDYARKYVAADPYAEEMYQALMIFHHATGNKSMIAKTYAQCKAKMEIDMDSLLSEETTELFKHLAMM